MSLFADPDKWELPATDCPACRCLDTLRVVPCYQCKGRGCSRCDKRGVLAECDVEDCAETAYEIIPTPKAPPALQVYQTLTGDKGQRYKITARHNDQGRVFYELQPTDEGKREYLNRI